MNRDDFDVETVRTPDGRVRFVVRRHPRICGFKMPWTVAVKNLERGYRPVFFHAEEVNRTLDRLCGKE